MSPAVELIDPNEVSKLMLSLMFNRDELVGGKPPEGDMVVVEGVANTFGMHRGRLAAAAPQVKHWLLMLHKAFMKSVGGGWSFTQLCWQDNGELWTGLHLRMEELMCIAIGLGLMEYLEKDRTFWLAFPEGMPYVIIHDDLCRK